MNSFTNVQDFLNFVENQKISQIALSKLAKNSSSYVRYKVLEHPNVYKTLIKELTNDFDYNVKIKARQLLEEI